MEKVRNENQQQQQQQQEQQIRMTTTTNLFIHFFSLQYNTLLASPYQLNNLKDNKCNNFFSEFPFKKDSMYYRVLQIFKGRFETKGLLHPGSLVVNCNL